MKKSLRFPIKILLVVLSIFTTVDVSAIEAINQSENIFRFQQKLANNGNAYAQYKLATMYEAGIGVETDLNLAREWYKQSSAEGVKAASDRNIYLTVKEQGYDKAVHQSWLDGIKANAKKRDVEAMFLLGQLYHNGVGVKKNLDKSLALLTYVNSTGSGNVDNEIALIRDEISTNKIAAEKQKQKVSANRVSNKKLRKQQQIKAQSQARANTQAKPHTKAKSPAEAKKQAMIEKRRRYEKVMAQIRLEQKKIDEQQAQVTNGEIASIDDEF